MASGHDPGGERHGSAIPESIDEVVLSGQDHGEVRFGVSFELGQVVQFGKDVESHEGGLVDDEDGFDLFGQGQIEDFVSDGADEKGSGVACGLDAQFGEQETVEFEDGAG